MAHHHPSGQPGVLGVRVPRRTFLGVAGLSVAGLLGARAALAGQGAVGAGAVPVAEALSTSAIDDLAFALDYDLDRIFRHVADDIWYDPYGGVLRGASANPGEPGGQLRRQGPPPVGAARRGGHARTGSSSAPSTMLPPTTLWATSQVDATTAQDHAAAVLTQSTGSRRTGGSRPDAWPPWHRPGHSTPGGRPWSTGSRRTRTPIVAVATIDARRGCQAGARRHRGPWHHDPGRRG